MLDQLARDNGFEVAVRDGTFSFAPPATASTAPSATAEAAPNPLVLELGKDLLRFRSVLTSAQQVGKVEVRGWDVATKQPLTATAPAQTRSAELPTVTPEQLAKTFGDPTYVATDVPYRTQAEVDEAARLAGRGDRRHVRRVRGRGPGQPEAAGGRLDQRRRAGRAVRRQVHRHHVPAPVRPDAPATPPSFSVTGRQDRTLLGLASGGSVGRTAPAPIVIGQVNDVADPEKQGRVKLQFPWLYADYVSDWARTVQPGAGKDRG